MKSMTCIQTSQQLLHEECKRPQLSHITYFSSIAYNYSKLDFFFLKLKKNCNKMAIFNAATRILAEVSFFLLQQVSGAADEPVEKLWLHNCFVLCGVLGCFMKSSFKACEKDTSQLFA